jgi:hypothetical protein
MNLTTDAWIPIVWNDGKPGTASLREAFERGDAIQDLALPTPARANRSDEAADLHFAGRAGRTRGLR